MADQQQENDPEATQLPSPQQEGEGEDPQQGNNGTAAGAGSVYLTTDGESEGGVVGSTANGGVVTSDYVNEHFQNLVLNDDHTGKPIILDSIYKLNELRAMVDTTVSRVENSNLDYVISSEGDFLHCHLIGLIDFTHGNGRGYKHAFESAAAISMAAQHLNEGIGWIVPEISGINELCPIRFTTEFVDTEYEQGVALQQIINITDRIPGDKSTQPLPCGFIGPTRSSGTLKTSAGDKREI